VTDSKATKGPTGNDARTLVEPGVANDESTKPNPGRAARRSKGFAAATADAKRVRADTAAGFPCRIGRTRIRTSAPAAAKTAMSHAGRCVGAAPADGFACRPCRRAIAAKPGSAKHLLPDHTHRKAQDRTERGSPVPPHLRLRGNVLEYEVENTAAGGAQPQTGISAKGRVLLAPRHRRTRQYHRTSRGRPRRSDSWRRSRS